jgi:hypothetical protein
MTSIDEREKLAEYMGQRVMVEGTIVFFCKYFRGVRTIPTMLLQDVEVTAGVAK